MCTGLTFSHPAPRRPAAYGASSAFTTTPSCPAASAASNSRAASSASSATARGTRSSARRPRASASLRRASGSSSRSSPSTCSTSKNSEASGVRPRTARAEARGGDLERLGPPVGAQRDRLPVEHDRAHRQRARRGDHLGQPRGHVVERAREQRDVVAVAMDLDPRAVELRVDRGRPGPGERGRDVGRGAGEHRRQRAPDLEPDRRQAVAPSRRATAATAARSPCSVSARRSSRRGHPGRPAAASVITPASAPWRRSPSSSRDQEVLLRRGRPRQQRRAPPRGARPPSPDRCIAPIAPNARSSSATVSVASAAGAGASRSSA